MELISIILLICRLYTIWDVMKRYNKTYKHWKILEGLNKNCYFDYVYYTKCKVDYPDTGLMKLPYNLETL